jgi:large conductance mechanosensitive channel
VSVWQEFKKFAVRGNVVDLAVGVIIGSAFGKITTSLVSDVIMPVVGLLIGKVDFANLFISLNGKSYPSLAVAKAATAPTLNYGLFINTVLDFLILAFAVFWLIRLINRVKGPKEEPASTTRECPYCLSDIPKRAVRCASCTATVEPEPMPQ